MPKVSQALPPLRAAATATIAALDLQRLAGNQAVAAAVEQISQRALQRVQVKETPPDETLYNQKGTGDTAKAKSYGGDVSYDMVRNGDCRGDRHDPDPVPEPDPQHRAQAAAGPATDPELGDLIGKPTEIPANDPDNRRDWCQNIVKEQVKPWNGKLTPGRRGGQRHRQEHPEAAAGDLRLRRRVRARTRSTTIGSSSTRARCRPTRRAATRSTPATTTSTRAVTAATTT